MGRTTPQFADRMGLAVLFGALAFQSVFLPRIVRAAAPNHPALSAEHPTPSSAHVMLGDRAQTLTANSRATQTAPLSLLDLRPPSFREFSLLTNDHLGGRMGVMPLQGGSSRSKEEDSSLSSLGTAGQGHIMGRAQAFAERFHREGLPIARLWENHSALVSLGLNQKGKAGLWLVQKTH